MRLFWSVSFLALCALCSQAATVNLIPTGAVWKYLDNGTDQGTAWQAPGFNDGSWTNGPAQLGYGDGDEATLINFGPDPNNKYVTYYFRRSFNVADPTVFQDLIINLLRDDGAVVYINGTEVWRISMPPGPFNYLTFATTAAEYTFETNVVSASALVAGVNVIAVEVHQGTTNSSDVSFDLGLIGRTTSSNALPTVSITNLVNNATVAPPVTISASASDPDGTVTLVEFFANGSKIGEDPTSPFSISWSPGAGNYALTAVATDNSAGRGTSGVVNVHVTGNVAPTATITSPTNNAVFSAPGNVTIQATASDSDGSVTNVDFFAGVTKIGQDNTFPYSIIWTNAVIGTFSLTAVASDNAGATGVSPPISITFTGAGPTILVASNSNWKYLDNGSDQNTAWIAPAFNDSGWSNGLAQLGYGDGDERTILSFGPDPNNKYITTYFRRSFTVANPSGFSFLTLGLWRDDGAVVYLNGTEVYRSNMPGGTVNYLTLALNAGDDGNQLFTTTVNTNTLIAGNNVLAVEIHQTLPTSSDISFDLFLIGQTGAINNNLPTVAITSPADGAFYTEPANININAAASDSDGSVTKVEFYQGNVKLGEDTTSPYGFLWGGVTEGNYQLKAVATDNLSGVSTSAVVNVFVTISSKPTLASVNPAAGSVLSNITQATVTFSQPVSGVDAADLLVNGVPASSVTGSNAVYTFTFTQPAEGVVALTWRSNHGIANFETPPKSFDELGAGASWQYRVVDNVRPTMASIRPAAGATVDSLNEIVITFSEAVGGLQAADLLVNGQPCSSFSGSSAGPYHFNFPQPNNGTVTVAWTNNHGIHDFAAAQNPFAGGSWTYTLNTNLQESAVVINEIMYHPSSQLASEEYLELFNRTNVAINITGWRLSGGVKFSFPTISLPAGGYLVIAANTNVFRAKYPSVANVIGNWDGRLSDSTDNINLNDANGNGVGSVRYADGGDWAVRQQTILNGYNGWIWSDEHDGGGKSLELRNPNLPNDLGQNWGASVPPNGTPGAVNSLRTNNIPPMILEAQHYPLVPTSTNTVTISARLLDEQTTGLSATLFYRDHTTTSPGAFVSAAMFDDGAHNDGVAGDGVFAITLPAQPNGTIIEFYIQASDASGATRTWPAAARLLDSSFAQQANALYQVDDSPTTTSMPFFRLVLTGTERDRLFQIGSVAHGQSDAEMNVALVTVDGTGTKLWYNVGIRHRGAGSRGVAPFNFRVGFPSDHLWNDMDAFAMNAHFPNSQVAGNYFARKAGLVSEDPFAIQARINGNNEGGPIGAYIWLQDIGSAWAKRQFPDDGNGNAYRCTRPSSDLAYLGTNPQSYINAGYSKQSNAGENDWSDLINLTFILNNTPDSDFTRVLHQRLNVEEWVRYLAVLSVVSYGETAIGSDGAPDDFSMYRGEIDPRFLILAHDHDTDFGEGDSPAPINRSLFAAGANAVMNRFLNWPDFTPLYYGELKRLCDTICSPMELAKGMDYTLGGWVPSGTIESMRAHGSNRVAFILSQIQTNFTLNVGLPIVNGYYQSASATVALNGTASAITTRSVKVNGQFATWSHINGTWSINPALQPGVNTVTVQALDGNGKVLNQTSVEIWYDDGSVAAVSGTLGSSTIWTAAGGPYNVTANLIIPAGVMLTIQPGATVYLNSGVGITVASGGQLIANGTESARIRFTRTPGSTVNWGNITINGAVGSPESRISYAHFEFNANNTGIPALQVSAGTVFCDHLTFGNTAAPYIHLDGASFVIQDCVFPSATAQFELVHGTAGIKSGGRGIFMRNFFGVPIAYNDVVDFTGGNRPGPIVQFIDNVFIGATDDILDLDSTDAWIEHNIFLHSHKNGSPDSSSAISGGADNPDTSQITIIGNIIYDVDQAANAKQGNFYTFLNNTIVHQSHLGGTDTNGAVALLSDIGTAEGLGMYLEGNIIYDAEKLVFGQTAAIVTYTNNIISNLQGPAWSGPGGNNVNADPLFKHLPQLSETTAFNSWASAQVLWDWFSLQTGSPAAGTGPNGRDKGGVIPLGTSISGEPVGTTSDRSATLRVGINRTGSGIPTAGFPDGSGYTHYKWRLDAGAWSAETPTATPITLTSLAGGPHLVQVVGKRDSGYYQDDPEYGSEALVTLSRQWTVNTNSIPLRINEVLAANTAAVPVGGTRFPDLVELYNPSSSAISLTGMALTDNKDEPFKFRFPAGATIGPGQYLVLYADSDSTPPGFHLGFALKQDGDDLYLFSSEGRLIDSVVFGSQLTDLSIGRLADGNWALTRPTFGAANIAERTGDVRAVKINEWLANEFTAASDDFIELFNPGSLPVDLGGRYLSDSPFGDPTRSPITPLSFIAGGGFLAFIADGNDGAGHANFKLSPEQGMISLADRDVTIIDCILYGPQTTDISQGRQPNGSANFVFFTTPTPGAPNPGIIIPNQTLTINEVLAFNTDIRVTNVVAGVTIVNTPDFVELYNPSGSSVNIGDMSLTDDPIQPRKYVFTNGITIGPLGYFVIRCDADVPPAADNTGFGLSQGGNVTLLLYDKLANGGSELSRIKFGIQAANYSIGRIPNGSNNWVLNLVTLGRPNGAATLGNPANLKINEWMAGPASGPDWFEIYNPNNQPVAIGGYYLTDDLAIPVKHQIHELSFIGIAGHGYQQFKADSDPAAGADHVNFALRNAGEALGLAGPSGAFIQSLSFGAQQTGVSEGRLPDGSANIVKFPTTASPGDANYLPLGNIVINEVLSHTDVGANFEDAIELLNTGPATNIGGWYLSDSKTTLNKYQIPPGTILSAGGFKVFYEYQFNFDPVHNGNAFALNSAKGDEVYLAQATNGVITGYRASVKFGAAANTVSFGRYTNSVGQVDFTAMTSTSFGADNPDSITEFRTGAGAANPYPKVGPVVISEIMYHPPDINGTTDDVLDEYVELQNITGTAVQLYHPSNPANTWQFRDGINFTFPMGVTLQPGQTLLVVSFDPVNDANSLAAFRAHYNITTPVLMYGPYSGKLDNGGEELGLYKPDAPEPPGDPDAGFVPYVLVDRVVYSDRAPWYPGADGFGQSLTRVNLNLYGNDPANWTAATPTPAPTVANPDRDGDGIPNDWEIAYGLNPDDPSDASQDPDGDGYTNLQEYQAGTDPRNPLVIRISGHGPVLLQFNATSNTTYTIQYRTNLTLGTWQSFTNVPAGPARAVQYADPASNARRFYRLRAPSLP